MRFSTGKDGCTVTKLFSLFLLAAISVAMVGCGAGETKPKAASTGAASSEKAK